DAARLALVSSTSDVQVVVVIEDLEFGGLRWCRALTRDLLGEVAHPGAEGPGIVDQSSIDVRWRLDSRGFIDPLPGVPAKRQRRWEESRKKREEQEGKSGHLAGIALGGRKTTRITSAS